jgi:hypothetical protein
MSRSSLRTAPASRSSPRIDAGAHALDAGQPRAQGPSAAISRRLRRQPSRRPRASGRPARRPAPGLRHQARDQASWSSTHCRAALVKIRSGRRVRARSRDVAQHPVDTGPAGPWPAPASRGWNPGRARGPRMPGGQQGRLLAGPQPRSQISRGARSRGICGQQVQRRPVAIGDRGRRRRDPRLAIRPSVPLRQFASICNLRAACEEFFSRAKIYHTVRVRSPTEGKGRIHAVCPRASPSSPTAPRPGRHDPSFQPQSPSWRSARRS